MARLNEGFDEPVTSWRGTIEGVSCEIKHWKRDNSYIAARFPDEPVVMKFWTFYHTIYREQIEGFDSVFLGAPLREGFRPGRQWMDYGALQLDDLFEFHGGITFYEPVRDDISGEVIGVTVGCDYQHAWDRGRKFTLNMVLADCRQSVEKFVESFPDYKVRSSWDGSWHKRDEVEEYDRVASAKGIDTKDIESMFKPKE